MAAKTPDANTIIVYSSRMIQNQDCQKSVTPKTLAFYPNFSYFRDHQELVTRDFTRLVIQEQSCSSEDIICCPNETLVNGRCMSEFYTVAEPRLSIKIMPFSFHKCSYCGDVHYKNYS